VGNRRKQIWGIAAGSVLCVGFISLAYTRYFNVSPFNEPPLGTASRTLTDSEVQSLLAQNFQIVRRVRQVPASVKQSWENVVHLPFDMNNPGDTLSGDLIIPGVPSRQLMFAGIGQSVAFLVWKQGAYADTFHLAVFSYNVNGGKWAARLNRPLENISDQKLALTRGEFHATNAP
jgi:hypothetical protein